MPRFVAFWNLGRIVAWNELSSNRVLCLEVLLTVVGKLADPAQGRPDMSIDAAFEGIEDTTDKHCYISINEKSQASIDIGPSAVTKLKLLNRGDECCGMLKDNKVY